MRISKQHALSLCVFASIAVPASAQFDNQWVRFVQENSRLKDSSGNPAAYLTGDTQEKDMFAGDLNKDGWLDLVIVRKGPATNGGPTSPNYLLMNENGNLVDRTAQYASASDVPGDNGFLAMTNDRDVVFVDVNNDGWLDVVTCTTRSASQPKYISHPRVYMNLGSSGGTWLGLRFENNRIPTFPISPNFCGVDAADITGDGFADLYFTDYGEGASELFDRILINDGTGNFTDSGFTRQTTNMANVRFGSAVDIVDMNMDGLRDIVRASGVTGNSGAGSLISVAYNDPGNIGFFPESRYQAQVGSGATYHVDTGDLNNDNRPDIIMSDDGGDGYRYNLGTDALGRVIWGGLHTYSYVTGTDDGFAGNNHIVDLDGDGWKDAIHCDFDVDVFGCTRRSHIFHNLGGTPGSEVVLKEEAGTAPAWRGAVGLLASDLIGTFDVCPFDIDNDGDVDMVYGRCSGTFVWMNQKFQPTTFTGFCFGDGSSGACPCGPGASGNGCPSSVSATGGKLAGAGIARISADSLTLTNTLVPNGPGLYYQGSGQTDVAFGDGKLCAGSGIIRLGVVFASSSTSTYPGGLTPNPVHVQGVTNAGDVRHYQTWYRDAAVGFCTASLFNLTNGVTLTWTP